MMLWCIPNLIKFLINEFIDVVRRRAYLWRCVLLIVYGMSGSCFDNHCFYWFDRTNYLFQFLLCLVLRTEFRNWISLIHLYGCQRTIVIILLKIFLSTRLLTNSKLVDSFTSMQIILFFIYWSQDILCYLFLYIAHSLCLWPDSLRNEHILLCL